MSASGRTFDGNRVLDGSDWSRVLLSRVLVAAGKALIDNMSLLFTLGVAVGMADEQDGTAALAGVASWIVVQQILTVDNVLILTGDMVDASSFEHIQISGRAAGMLGAYCSDTYRKCHFDGLLHVFGGKRSGIPTAVAQSAAASLALLFLLLLYGICVYGRIPGRDRGAWSRCLWIAAVEVAFIMR